MPLYVGEKKVEKIYQGIEPVTKIMHGEIETPVYVGYEDNGWHQTDDYEADGVTLTYLDDKGKEILGSERQSLLIDFRKVYSNSFYNTISQSEYFTFYGGSSTYGRDLYINMPVNNNEIKITAKSNKNLSINKINIFLWRNGQVVERHNDITWSSSQEQELILNIDKKEIDRVNIYRQTDAGSCYLYVSGFKIG